MASSAILLRRIRRYRRPYMLVSASPKTTSAQHVAARHTDHTFEKLMDSYKHYPLVSSIADLLLASPSGSLPLSVLQPLRIPTSPSHFLRRFPLVFSLHPNPLSVRLTPLALSLSRLESSASSPSHCLPNLLRLLLMSSSRSLPLRAILRSRKPLALPDDFESSVISANPDLLHLCDNPREANTHLLTFLPSQFTTPTPAIELWRNSNSMIKGKFAFNHQFPPGLRLRRGYKQKIGEWQALRYPSPYDPCPKSLGKKEMEKRAVAIAHEFLCLTVEKLVEVEQFSQFRKWFGIELNVRDLFLDHPGIFYLSIKGGRHTVFLREAYKQGRLVESNPVYEARRQMLDLVAIGRRGTGGRGGEFLENVQWEEIESSDCKEVLEGS